jgi:peroxiredoxin Q/BCP
MAELVEREVQVLGASTDNRADNAAFADKEGFNFPLLCDTDRDLSLAYHAVTTTEGIAKRISYLIGPDGHIEKAYASVSPQSHPAEVIRDVDALTG